MTVLDLGNNIAVTRQITPQVLSASSGDATAVDLAGETYAIVVIDCGAKAGTTSAYTFKVEEASDNATFTTAKKLVDGEVSTTDAEIAVTATAGATDDRQYLIAMDARRLKRYVRIACDLSGGGSDNFPVSCSIITMPNYTGDAGTPDLTV
tara:strand:- start:5526 stop:5978 length:453 start_codon:yes stop_codon:yes gene_type:complete